MMIAKSVLASAVLAASLGAGGVATAQAANQGHLQSMVDSLSTEFSLNSEDVENSVREFKHARGMRIAGLGNDGQAHLQAFADAFAAEYGLSADDVVTTLDGYHQARLAQGSGLHLGPNGNKANSLQQAVDTGHLTQAQADAITAKHLELVDFKASLEGLTPEERHEAVQVQAQAISDWADANDISLGNRLGTRRVDNIRNLRAHARNQTE